MRICLICLTQLLSGFAVPAAHNSLLPRPQQVEYGSGTVAVRGLSIDFASPPNAEDTFTGEQLASRLSRLVGAKIKIAPEKASGSRIVLNRTREGGGLPADTENPGPESRES